MPSVYTIIRDRALKVGLLYIFPVAAGPLWSLGISIFYAYVTPVSFIAVYSQVIDNKALNST